MPDYSSMSDADLMALVQPKGAVDYSKMSDADLMKAVKGSEPQGFVANAMDFVKSIPRGIVSGLTSAPNPSMVPIADEQVAVAPTRAQATETLKASTPEPQGRAGKFGQAIGEGLGNPLTYAGPGGIGLKLGGSVLSSLGGEGGRQAAEGTKFETPTQLAGALIGGGAAAKAFGPSAPKAAIPTASELFNAGGSGYKTANATGLELHPQGVSNFASKVEQDLIGPDHAFTGGKYGSAPKTLDAITALRELPDRIAAATKADPIARGIFGAADLDGVRKNLGRIAKETNDGKPTPDAAAASIALEHLANYAQDIPKSHILAGNAEDYVRAIKQANGDWAAGSRTAAFDARLTKAENATDRQVAGSLDSQIKSKAGQMLDNPKNLRGLNQAEKDQLQLINSGGPISNTMRQLGRGGAGVIPIMGQLAAAGPVLAAGGPLALAGQVALAGGLYGARKGSEAITKSRAKTLAEMLAKRSPEYESRLKAVGPQDNSPNIAAMARALLAH